MAGLSPVGYGLVTGRYGVFTGDGVDVDTFPEFAPATGTITFAPSPTALLVAGATPPTTVLPLPIIGTLDANGQLKLKLPDTSFQDLYLPATNDPDTNPVVWTYRVVFDLKYGTTTLNYGPIVGFEVPEGGTVDLTTAAPVPSNPGTPTMQGPAGPTGPGVLFLGPSDPVPEDTPVPTLIVRLSA